jgi:hypothetical protein
VVEPLLEHSRGAARIDRLEHPEQRSRADLRSVGPERLQRCARKRDLGVTKRRVDA